MRKGWATTSLGEFVTLQRGHDLPEITRRQGAIPIIGSFGITGWHDEAKATGPGVTVGRSGASFGVVTYSASDYWPLNTALYVVDFHGNDERFAYYLLRSLDFAGFNSGSAQPSLNRNFIHAIEIQVPPLPEQRAIAHILGTLDDKIELNRRMNQTLEEIARELFKSWFVDFDPVHAKAAGRQPAGMDAATAALFPSEFEESELGLIPKGWRVGTLTDISNLSRDSVNPGLYPDTLFAHYSIPAYDKGVGPISEPGSQIRSGKYKVPRGSVLISKLNPEIDRVWLPDLEEETNPICSTEFMVFEATGQFDSAFVYCLARTEAFRSSLRGQVTGTSKSHQRAQPSSVLTMAVIIPGTELVERAALLLVAVFAKVQGNLKQSRTLSRHRDTLLPKLISGELRTEEADKQNGRIPPLESCRLGCCGRNARYRI